MKRSGRGVKFLKLGGLAESDQFVNAYSLLKTGLEGQAEPLICTSGWSPVERDADLVDITDPCSSSIENDLGRCKPNLLNAGAVCSQFTDAGHSSQQQLAEWKPCSNPTTVAFESTSDVLLCDCECSVDGSGDSWPLSDKKCIVIISSDEEDDVECIDHCDRNRSPVVLLDSDLVALNGDPDDVISTVSEDPNERNTSLGKRQKDHPADYTHSTASVNVNGSDTVLEGGISVDSFGIIKTKPMLETKNGHASELNNNNPSRDYFIHEVVDVTTTGRDASKHRNVVPEVILFPAFLAVQIRGKDQDDCLRREVDAMQASIYQMPDLQEALTKAAQLPEASVKKLAQVTQTSTKMAQSPQASIHKLAEVAQTIISGAQPFPQASVDWMPEITETFTIRTRSPQASVHKLMEGTETFTSGMRSVPGLSRVTSKELFLELQRRRLFFACFCGASFLVEELFLDHLMYHTPGNPMMCAFCEELFPDSFTFNKHLLLH